MPDTFPHEDVRSGVIPKKKGTAYGADRENQRPDDFGKVKDSPKKCSAKRKRKDKASKIVRTRRDKPGRTILEKRKSKDFFKEKGRSKGANSGKKRENQTKAETKAGNNR